MMTNEDYLSAKSNLKSGSSSNYSGSGSVAKFEPLSTSSSDNVEMNVETDYPNNSSPVEAVTAQYNKVDSYLAAKKNSWSWNKSDDESDEEVIQPLTIQ